MRRLARVTTHHSEVDSEGTWAISYGDMITLLLSFFVLFFTLDPEKEKVQEMDRQLFQVLAGMTNPKGGGDDEKMAGSSQMTLGEKDNEPSIDAVLLRRLGAKVHHTGRRILVEFPGATFFATGSTEVTPQGAKALEAFTERYMPFMSMYDLNIRAFTDPRPVRAANRRYQDNLELSALRAVAAMRVLQRAGIPLQLMKLGGHGESLNTARELKNLNEKRDPAAVNDVLALARRVVLVIEPKPEATK